MMSLLLTELPVIAVDCQTTGATPKSGQVIELAWALFRAKEREEEVVSSLIALQDEDSLSRRVSRITGLRAEDLEAAATPEKAWRSFEHDVLLSREPDELLLVAHYARFERPFFEELAKQYGSADWKLRFVCTYELSRRLYPDLSRHSLRTLAGHLGHPLRETRRSRDHVAATAHIWRSLIRELNEQKGIQDLPSLMQFLDTPPPGPTKRTRFPLSAEKRQALPASPGSYRFLDAHGNILYIGKARHLKNRVASYFQPGGHKPSHIREMIPQAFDLHHTRTETALEAALLEADAIKQHNPPYNRALKTNTEEIWFFDENYQHPSHKRSTSCTRGPFAKREPMEALLSVCAMMNVGDSGVPVPSPTIPEFGGQFVDPPTPDILSAGIQQFKTMLSADPKRPFSPTSLLAQGAILQHFAVREVDKDDADAPRNEPAGNGVDEPTWTAERVTRSLARVAITAAHAWQRALWFRLLSESVIVWRPRNAAGDKRRQVIIEKGLVREARSVNEEEALSNPPGSFRPLRERSNDFDRTVFDRLRVLTTELKRLLSKETEVTVILAPTCRLNASRLARLIEGV